MEKTPLDIPETQKENLQSAIQTIKLVLEPMSSALFSNIDESVKNIAEIEQKLSGEKDLGNLIDNFCKFLSTIDYLLNHFPHHESKVSIERAYVVCREIIDALIMNSIDEIAINDIIKTQREKLVKAIISINECLSKTGPLMSLTANRREHMASIFVLKKITEEEDSFPENLPRLIFDLILFTRHHLNYLIYYTSLDDEADELRATLNSLTELHKSFAV